MESNEKNYAFESPFILENYRFYWRYHSNPMSEIEHETNFLTYASQDHIDSGFFHGYGNGHPLIFPLLGSLFPKEYRYTVKDTGSIPFLNPSQTKLETSAGKANIQDLVINHDGSATFTVTGGDLRIVSVIFSTMTILLIFMVTKEWYNVNVALVSSSIFSFAPPVINAAKHSSNESVYGFFLIFSLYYYFKTFEVSSFKNSLGAGVFHGLALGTKFYSFIGYPILVCYLLLTRKKVGNIKWALIFSVFVLSVFSHPISAVREILNPSDLSIPFNVEYILNINFQVIMIIGILSGILVLSDKIYDQDKLIIIFLLAFSITPYLTISRALILAPFICVMIGRIFDNGVNKISKNLSTMRSVT
jgi:succinate dehydrogenase hydrophobic anchor subunit